jgi:hypothetical protein
MLRLQYGGAAKDAGKNFGPQNPAIQFSDTP